MDPILSNKKVLIAEDEPAMLNALADKFGREGCVVTRAENGKIALDLATKEEPDVLLLDILMPKMSGMEVLSAIRTGSDWGKKVPIIMLTNLSPNEEIMGNIVKSEPSYYLIKSDWKLSEVIEKVRSCFKKSEL
jgi:two-component system response regulator ResD